MRISAKRAAQFRHAYRAGFSSGLHNLNQSPKTNKRWWIDAFETGRHYGRMRRYEITGDPDDWEPEQWRVGWITP